MQWGLSKVHAVTFPPRNNLLFHGLAKRHDEEEETQVEVNYYKREPNAAAGPVGGESDEVTTVEAWDCQGPAHNRGDQVQTSRLSPLCSSSLRGGPFNAHTAMYGHSCDSSSMV